MTKGLSGKVVCLTGTLSGFSRKEMTSLITKHGGKVSSSITKATNLVLAGSDAGSKLEKAEEMEIQVVSEEELLKMVGEEAPAKKEKKSPVKKGKKKEDEDEEGEGEEEAGEEEEKPKKAKAAPKKKAASKKKDEDEDEDGEEEEEGDAGGGGKLKGKLIALTGTLPSFTRKQITSLIEKHGGKVTSSVSKNTSIVLAGDDAGSKLEKAQELELQIMSEKELLDFVGEQAPVKEKKEKKAKSAKKMKKSEEAEDGEEDGGEEGEDDDE